MVITRRDVGDERTERIERSTVALLYLPVHILPDLLHGHMARSFDESLHVVLPSPLYQLTHRVELGKLGRIIGVVYASGTKAVAQRQAGIILTADLTDLIEVGI